MKNRILLITTLCGVTISTLFVGAKYTEYQDQEKAFNLSQHIRSVPIPQKISFAGEIVPLNKFEVLERLDRELTVNTFWQSNTLLILKRSKMYFEIIEPILRKNGVPDDFKYLAVAESGLQDVTSPSGAKGVWQFMPSSGLAYGLEINNNVDERYLLEKSTEAACQYLLEAYRKFGNWTLAAAAYNRGMSGISNDLNKQLVSDYYELHLNSETSRYLLRIIAFKAIFETPSTYGFHIEDRDYYAEPKTIPISIDSTIPNISEYAQSIGSNYHVIKSLNPWILGNELSVSGEKNYQIKAPLIN
jgi:membrane-bound lytic murein transglycosylase D